MNVDIVTVTEATALLQRTSPPSRHRLAHFIGRPVTQIQFQGNNFHLTIEIDGLQSHRAAVFTIGYGFDERIEIRCGLVIDGHDTAASPQLIARSR